MYNFNPSEHIVGNDHATNQRNGLNQAGYHQIESDFLNRSLSTSNNNETSVQLTRPTSKTALLVRQRRAMLEQLSCFICKGYLIDATTIDECMDSFCKSCIVTHLKKFNNCPKCGVTIQRQSSLSAIRSDKVLQDIVYKLIPGLYDDEMRRRREFYKEHYGATSSSLDDDDSSSTSSLNIQGSNLSGEQYGVVVHPKPFYKPSDSIDLSIEPRTRGDNSTIYYDNKRQSIVTCFTGSLQQRDLNSDGSTFSSADSQLFKTYLRCPARLTVLQLKKFIAAKFNICRDDTIHLLYLNESLKDEYSLIDVAYIYDWRGIEHMQLFYIIERDLSKMVVPDDCQTNYQADGPTRSGKVTRQSVGISTQTVKRVCIDPQPKYYDDKNNNNLNLVRQTEGRTLRSVAESPSSGASKTNRISQTNPIIRPYSSNKGQNGQEGSTPMVTIAGISVGAHSSHGPNRIFSTRSASRDESIGKDQPAPAERTEINEARSLRSQAAVRSKPTDSGPKVATNTGSVCSSSDRVGDNVSKQDGNKVLLGAPKNSSISQLVPYTGPKFTTSVAGSSQSSLVTLASFTEARSNHVIATLSSNSSVAPTITDSSRGMFNSTVRSNQESKIPTNPQLAFSFVTERGITIVRRINNQAEPTNSTSSLFRGEGGSSGVMSRTNSISALPANGLNSISSSEPNRAGSLNHVTSPNQNTRKFDISQPSSSQKAGEESGTSSRHHIKAKPVYRTFVDPTKLKSPNMKKLRFTARH